MFWTVYGHSSYNLLRYYIHLRWDILSCQLVNLMSADTQQPSVAANVSYPITMVIPLDRFLSLHTRSTKWSMMDQNLPAWQKIQSLGLNSTAAWAIYLQELPNSWWKRVLSLHINTSSGHVVFCESCIYTKAMWKPVAKVHNGEWAMELGGEVHTDYGGLHQSPQSKGTDTMSVLQMTKHASLTFTS